MKININLINVSTSVGNKDVRLKKIQNISYLALVVVAIFSVLLFLINLRFSVGYVQKQQAELEKELSVHDATTSKMLILSSRLDEISSVIETRRKYNVTAGKIIEKVPQNVIVQDFKIDDEGITIDVTSESLKDLNEFLNSSMELTNSKVIKNVFLDSLTTEKSVYRLILKAS